MLKTYGKKDLVLNHCFLCLIYFRFIFAINSDVVLFLLVELL